MHLFSYMPCSPNGKTNGRIKLIYNLQTRIHMCVCVCVSINSESYTQVINWNLMIVMMPIKQTDT